MTLNNFLHKTNPAVLNKINTKCWICNGEVEYEGLSFVRGSMLYYCYCPKCKEPRNVKEKKND